MSQKLTAVKKHISVEEMRKYLSYDAKTGEIRWLVRLTSSRGVGDIAGHKTKKGYRQIKFAKGLYLAHRVAWALHHGEWPSAYAEIDHINGIRDDNRIANLRLANACENKWNTPVTNRSTSGLKGATWHKRANKWSSQIQVNGRAIYLGYFESKEDAHAAYRAAAQRYHGDFARFNRGES